MQMATVNVHLFSRAARSLALAPGSPLCSDFHRQAAQLPACALFLTTPIEQDWVTARNPEPIPTACPC